MTPQIKQLRDDFYEHLFKCKVCNGRSHRYCNEGIRLKRLYYAPARAKMIIAQKQLAVRRRMMETTPEDIKPVVQAEVERLWKLRISGQKLMLPVQKRRGNNHE